MNLSKPSEEPLIKITEIQYRFIFEKLHPDSLKRHKFYQDVLEPSGHAKTKSCSCSSTGDILLLALSQEYLSALENEEESKFLQAFINVMY